MNFECLFFDLVKIKKLELFDDFVDVLTFIMFFWLKNGNKDLSKMYIKFMFIRVQKALGHQNRKT
jgi:hypothetical protein